MPWPIARYCTLADQSKTPEGANCGTEGDLSLGSGTLYQAIQRLEREGLIAGVRATRPGGYSVRNATSGSTRAARRAGPNAAMRPVAKSARAAAP